MKLSLQKILIASTLFLFPFSSFAATEEEINAIKQDITNIKQELNQFSNHSKEWQEKNFSHLEHKLGDMTLTGGITTVLQGTNNALVDGKEEPVIDYSYTFDLNLDAKVSNHGTVSVALEAGNGNGLNDNLDALSIVNYDPFITEAATASNSFATLSISQAYYQGEYYDGRMITSFGKMDIHSFTDENNYANDETSQFLAAIFSRSQGSIFAELDQYYAPGLVIAAGLTDWVDINFVAANGNNSGFEDITKNPYASAQLTLKNNMENHNGNYRFYWIGDYRDYTEISTGNAKENTGFGISIDQEIWKDHLGIFARYGMQDDGLDENTVKSGYSFGIQKKCSRDGSDKHIIGLAYGKLIINDESSLAPAAADDETHMELYYKLQLNDHFAISPDIQYMINPGGDANGDNVSVYGLRAQLNF